MTVAYTGKGPVFEAGGNNPFLLTGKGAAWVVLDGAVDVFSLRVSGGEAVGPRRHQARFFEGQVLFAIDPAQGAEGHGLLAVGVPGTKVAATDLAELASAGVTDLAAAVDVWVQAFTSGALKEIAPTSAFRLSGGGEFALRDGAVASPGEIVLWVRQLEGRSFVRGMEHVALEATDSRPFPLGGTSWIMARGDGRVHAEPTASVIERGRLSEHLDSFHATLVGSIARGDDVLERQRRGRLEGKTRAARRLFEEAIWNLASAIREREEAPTLAGADDPLLAACRMVAGRIGMRIVAPPPSSRTVSHGDRVDFIAAASRLRVRQVTLSGSWWRRDNGPLLAFAGEEEDPVAVLPTSPRRYVLHNPRTGKRVRVNAKVAAGISPVAFVFYRHLPETGIGFWQLIRFAVFGNRREIAMILLLGAAGGLLATLIPIFTGTIFDTVIPGANRGQMMQIGMALAAGALAAAIFEVARAVSMLRIEGRTDGHLQSAVIDRLLALPAPFFRDYSAGDLASRALGVSAIRETLSGPAMTALLALVFSSFSFFLLFVYSSRLAMMATVLILLVLAIGGAFTLAALARQRISRALEGQISGMMLQYITGIAKLKVSGCERRAFTNWANLFARKRKADFSIRRLTDMKLSIDSAVPVFCSMAIFWGVMGSDGLSTGVFLAFNAAFVQFMTAAIEMASVLQAVIMVIPLYDRLRPIIQTQPEVSLTKGDPGVLTGRIDISRVSFRYDPDGPEILRDVSLHIEPGEFVAVVGPSGSGKSTIFRLLLGFETPGQGAVYYDGQDLEDLDIRAVRRQMGVVLQNSQVMAGDLYSNIVGASNLTMDDAYAAAIMAGLEDDLKQMPMGLNTVVPAGGGTLSGGQRQRLMIARAIVKRPRILLFDEATSALDNRTQAVVSKSLASLTATRVVIAHRLSTIINADKIFVVEKGVVVQSGTYRELISQEGPFADIAKRQLV